MGKLKKMLLFLAEFQFSSFIVRMHAIVKNREILATVLGHVRTQEILAARNSSYHDGFGNGHGRHSWQRTRMAVILAALKVCRPSIMCGLFSSVSLLLLLNSSQ